MERVDPSYVPGLATDDVVGAVVCRTDGVGSPPDVTRELVRRAAELGVEVREQTRVEDVDADAVVIACGAWSAAVAEGFGVELPVRPLCRQLLLTTPIVDLPDDLPMVIEAESGLPLPPPRRPARARDARPAAALDGRAVARRVPLRGPPRPARRPLSARRGGRRRERMGRPLRHDAGRAPDHRPGGRRRLRRLRVLRSRLHAVARGREGARGGDPRRASRPST